MVIVKHNLLPNGYKLMVDDAVVQPKKHRIHNCRSRTYINTFMCVHTYKFYKVQIIKNSALECVHL